MNIMRKFESTIDIAIDGEPASLTHHCDHEKNGIMQTPQAAGSVSLAEF